MGRFEGFYTGGEATADNGGFSGSEVFAQRRLKKEREQVKTKQREQWETEYHKCSTQSALRNYINIHKNNTENPFVQQAKEKLDDLTFKSCKNLEDYKKYLSNFPSGRYTMQAQTAIKRFKESSIASSTSGISGDDVWEFVKKAIGVVAILAGIGAIYLWLTDQCNKTAAIGFCIVIVGPVCKWAFDD